MGASSVKLSPKRKVSGAVAQALVPILTHARRLHTWLDGMAFRQSGRTIVYTGELGG